MQRLKQNILLLSFILIPSVLSIFSMNYDWDTALESKFTENTEKKTKRNTSYFKNVEYFYLQESKPFLHLIASELTNNPTFKEAYFFDPLGAVHSSKGDIYYYQSEKGRFDQAGQKLYLNNEVKFNYTKSALTSDSASYSFMTDSLEASGRVKTKVRSDDKLDTIILNADRLVGKPRGQYSEYIGNATGKIIRKRPYEDGIDFTANKITLDGAQNLIGMDGDVFLKKQHFKAESKRGEIFIENYNKKLKYFALYDDVKVVEKLILSGTGRREIERKAYSEKLEGIMSEKKVVLTGYPKVYQLKDVIKGNMIILRENNETIEVDDANTNFYFKD